MFNRNLMRQTPFMNTPMQDGFIDINNNSGNIDIDFEQNQVNDVNQTGFGMTSSPVVEQMRERVVNRRIEHVVPQD